MSLILDALKKSEEERQSGTVSETAVSLGDASAGKRRRWPFFAAAGLLLLVAGIGAWGWRPGVVAPSPPVGEPERIQELTPPAIPSELAKAAPAPIPEPAKAVPAPAPIPEPAKVVPAPTLNSEIKPAAPNLPPAVEVKKPAVSLPPPASVKSRAEASAYNKRGQAFEREGLYDRAIEEYTQAVLLDSGYAEAYLGRGWAQEAKGNHEQAIDNFTQALKAAPSYGEAFWGRGWAHEQLGHANLAIEEYTQAINHAPDFPDAYFSRGFLYFYGERLEKAAGDFSQALARADKSLVPYALLWRYLSRNRAGGDGWRELVENAGGVNLDTWPGVIVALYMEKAGPAQVIAKTKDGDVRKQRENECVAFFFLGQYYLVRGDKAKAVDFFRKTMDTGVTGYRQYEAAKAELRMLGEGK